MNTIKCPFCSQEISHMSYNNDLIEKFFRADYKCEDCKRRFEIITKRIKERKVEDDI